VVTGPDTPADQREAVQSAGGRLLAAPLGKGRIDLGWLMGQLGAMGMASLLIEGGSQVAGAALRAGIVDKLCLFYAPKLLGGDDGVSICGGQGALRMKDSLPVKIETIHRFDEDLMVEAYPERRLPAPRAD
jgi:diaminohydroxyphosphoribosylaminopyrimidine deaminase/5-amino-6-(5-phosphoribosylamino)uracil reductase